MAKNPYPTVTKAIDRIVQRAVYSAKKRTINACIAYLKKAESEGVPIADLSSCIDRIEQFADTIELDEDVVIQSENRKVNAYHSFRKQHFKRIQVDNPSKNFGEMQKVLAEEYAKWRAGRNADADADAEAEAEAEIEVEVEVEADADADADASGYRGSKKRVLFADISPTASTDEDDVPVPKRAPEPKTRGSQSKRGSGRGIPSGAQDKRSAMRSPGASQSQDRRGAIRTPGGSQGGKRGGRSPDGYPDKRIRGSQDVMMASDYMEGPSSGEEVGVNDSSDGF
jgi:hypothetical protein